MLPENSGQALGRCAGAQGGGCFAARRGAVFRRAQPPMPGGLPQAAARLPRPVMGGMPTGASAALPGRSVSARSSLCRAACPQAAARPPRLGIGACLREPPRLCPGAVFRRAQPPMPGGLPPGCGETAPAGDRGMPAGACAVSPRCLVRGARGTRREERKARSIGPPSWATVSEVSWGRGVRSARHVSSGRPVGLLWKISLSRCGKKGKRSAGGRVRSRAGRMALADALAIGAFRSPPA